LAPKTTKQIRKRVFVHRPFGNMGTGAMELLVNIDVDNLEKAIHFYAAAFGLKVGRRIATGSVEMLGLSAPLYLLTQAQGTQVSSATSQRRRYDRHWTPVHLDFVVAEMESAVQKAVSAGARLEAPIATHAWGRLALMADPFGNGFCFVQFLGRGYDEIA
jgi:predicted enzyme related to lactoylglutathione lyase